MTLSELVLAMRGEEVLAEHEKLYERAIIDTPDGIVEIGRNPRKTRDGYRVDLDLDAAIGTIERYRTKEFGHNHPAIGERDLRTATKRTWGPVLKATKRPERKELLRELTEYERSYARFGQFIPSPQDVQTLVVLNALDHARWERPDSRYFITTRDGDTRYRIDYALDERVAKEGARLIKQRDEKGLESLAIRTADTYGRAMLQYLRAHRANGVTPNPFRGMAYLSQRTPVSIGAR